MNVYYLTNAPTPYKQAFWNELGKYCQLTVLLEVGHSNERDESWKTERNGNYNEIVLPHVFRRASGAFCPSVKRYLKRKDGIVIINGYNTFTGIYAILYCKIHNLPYIISADGGLLKTESWMIAKVKKFLLRNATGYLSSGKVTDEYLKHYGADINRIGHYPFTSVSQAQVLKQIVGMETKKQLREKLGIHENQMVISVGQFIHRKGFDILFKACDKLQRDMGVYIVGGEPTQEYMDLKERCHLDNIHFLPFMKHDQLYPYLQAADLFVLSTREDIWGLVVNEAMANGLPVITTDKCVAGLEMIPGNPDAGIIIHTEDIEELAKAIDYTLVNEEIRLKAAKAALERASNFTIENMAKMHYEFIMEQRIKQVCGIIYNEVKERLSYYIAPILILPSVNNNQMNDIIANGTGTLLKLKDKYLLVTCYHVWDYFIEKKKAMPSAICALFAGDCKILNLTSLEPLSHSKEKDLVVFDISPFVENDQIGVKKFIMPEEWPYKRPEIDDLVLFLGYPGQIRQPDKSRINIAWYFDFIRNISNNSIILRDENQECIEEYYDKDLPLLTDLGGFSGCPVLMKPRTFKRRSRCMCEYCKHIVEKTDGHLP